MTDRENFIARWSRRKRATADDADATKAAAPAADESVEHSEQNSEHASADKRAERGATAAQGAASELPFDLTKLPPIESIGADTDIRAFLAPGVPTELTRAALRRAWAADPKVRDFVGLADYDWDFNAPGAMTGFGSLEMTDELRQQIARMVGGNLANEATGSPAQTSAEVQGKSAPAETSTESVATVAEMSTQ